MIWCALIRSRPLVEAAIVNAINLRIGKTLISVLAFAVLAATAQEASTGTMQGAERVDRKIAALRERLSFPARMAAARAEALEEAAQLCDEYASRFFNQDECRACALAIRALKEKP